MLQSKRANFLFVHFKRLAFIKHMCLENIRNADVRTSIIEVSKLKQAIEMAEALQQVLVESTSKKARKSYSREYTLPS